MVNQTKQRKLRCSTSKKTKSRTRKNTKRMAMRTNKMRGGAGNNPTETSLYFKGMLMKIGSNYKLFYKNDKFVEYYVVGTIKSIENNKITFQYNNVNNTIDLNVKGYPHKILFDFRDISDITYTADEPKKQKQINTLKNLNSTPQSVRAGEELEPIMPMPVTPMPVMSMPVMSMPVGKPKVEINQKWFFLPENLEENKKSFMQNIDKDNLQQAEVLFNRFPGCKTFEDAQNANADLYNKLNEKHGHNISSEVNEEKYNTWYQKELEFFKNTTDDVRHEGERSGGGLTKHVTLNPNWWGWAWQLITNKVDPIYTAKTYK